MLNAKKHHTKIFALLISTFAEINQIQVLGTGLYTSAFLKINGLLRKLYFLPRVTKANTGEEVEMKDVHEEVDTLFTRLKISSGSDWKAKSCSRKYAFELPDIPKESDYLKVLYPYDRESCTPSMNICTSLINSQRRTSASP